MLSRFLEDFECVKIILASTSNGLKVLFYIIFTVHSCYKTFLVDVLEKTQALGLSAYVVHDLLEKQYQIDKDKSDRVERPAEREARRREEYHEAERQRAHELELARIKPNSLNEFDSNSSSSNSHMFEGHRLPTFTDGQDDLDSYLQRFERLPELHGWNCMRTTTHI